MSKFLSGQWNALCDRCGLQFKSRELRKDWQGLMVDAKCYEQRHPQDLIRVRPERAIPDWVRPATERFLLNTRASDTFSFVPDTTSGQDYIDPTYFLEDYIGSRVQITVTFIRSFSDAVPLSETFSTGANKLLAESLPLVESFTALSQTARIFTDSSVMDDSGTIIHFNYVDPSYFAEDYVGEYTLF